MVLDREGEQRGDLLVRAGADDEVGRVAEVTAAGAKQVGGRLAAGAQPTRLVVGEHVLGAEQVAQSGHERLGDVGRGHGRLLECRLVVEAEGQLDQAASGVGQRGRALRGTPSLGVHLGLRERELHRGHVLHCDT